MARNRTVVTKQQQESLGFTDPTQFSNALANFENIGGSLSQIANNAGNITVPQTTPTIDVSNIGSPQSQQFRNLAPEQLDTTAGLEALIRSLASFQTTPEIDNTESLIDLLGERATEIETQLGNLPADRLALEQELGLGDLRTQQRDIFAQAQQLQANLASGLANEGARRASGMFKTGREASMRQQTAAELAGLAAISSALEGQISSAQEYINTQTEIKYSALQSQLNNVDRSIQLNKDKMTRQESRLAERKQTEIQLLSNRLQRQQDAESDAKKQLINAVNLGMSGAEAQGFISGLTSGKITPEEAEIAAAQYTGESARLDLAMKREQYHQMINALNNPNGLDSKTREKIGESKQAQITNSLINLNENLFELSSLVDKHGTVNVVDVKARGRINSLRSSLQLQIAEAFDQGAISDGDRDLYEDIVGKNWTSKNKVLGGIKEGIKTNDSKINSNIDFLEATYGSGVGSFEPFSEYRLDQELSEYVDSQTPDEEPKDPYSFWISEFGEFGINTFGIK